MSQICNIFPLDFMIVTQDKPYNSEQLIDQAIM